jgi:hypothetical protein
LGDGGGDFCVVSFKNNPPGRHGATLPGFCSFLLMQYCSVVNACCGGWHGLGDVYMVIEQAVGTQMGSGWCI